MSTSPEECVEALRLSVQCWGGAEWLGGRVDGDAIVVVFRQDLVRGAGVTTGPVQGMRLQFDEFAAVIFGPGTHCLDEVLGEATLEVVEPHEPGQRLQVPWADGLCEDPPAVLWRPDAVAAAAGRT